MSQQQAVDETLEALLDHLKRTRGFDLTGYKRASVRRRTMRRVQATGCVDFVEYLDYLQVHPEEFTPLLNTILINVTSFFRDPASWEYLAGEVVPRMLRNRREGLVRVWSAGCASGEEAYTLAMVLIEAMGIEAFRQQVKIYATDIDEEALAQARQGAYSVRSMQHVPLELRDRYFEEGGGHCTFRPDLRRFIIFGRHDLVQDAPISRLDLLVCRNTLMYFNADAQAQILARFHFALNDTGFLYLGRAEMLLTHANLFSPTDLKYRIFGKVARVTAFTTPVSVPTGNNVDHNNELARITRIREATFEGADLAQVVVDNKGLVLMANEQARTMFNLDRRDIGRPLQDLELSYRPVELRSLIERVYAEQRQVQVTNVERAVPGGERQLLDVQVAPLSDTQDRILGVAVSFIDVTRNKQLQMDLQRSHQELETAYEELQSSNEELETTNEELQSSNEELETTNEELQSSNEELETMNEELQSTNEELEAINEELRRRTDELDRANDFLSSVFASLRDGVAVLDEHAVVVIWNEKAEDLWGLRADEVRGRSFFDLDIGLPVEKLRDAIYSCLLAEAGRVEVVVEAVNRRGRAFRCAISCKQIAGSKDPRVIVLMEVQDGNQQDSDAAVEEVL